MNPVKYSIVVVLHEILCLPSLTKLKINSPIFLAPSSAATVTTCSLHLVISKSVRLRILFLA